MLKLAEIRIYPVKGLRGISVAEARVEPWGLAGDRRWMVVDAHDTFISQRQLPGMARIDAAPIEGGLRLSASGRRSIEVATPNARTPALEVAIWKNRVAAVPAGSEADRWLSAMFGVPCRLVHMADPAGARPVDPDYAAPDDRVSFADGYPLLVTNAASLSDLNTRLDRPVPMDRFRTNLLVAGAAAWAEDAWRTLRVGGAAFAAVKTCDRCVVTTVDQATGEKADDNEPLRTLGGFRRDARGRTIFGQNLIPRRLGRIAVGDPVTATG